MKLNCSVRVIYRSDLSSTSRNRAVASSLSLLLNPKDNKEVFLLYQTGRNNGIKYKIIGNIESIFTKFLSSGKATIRLKVPAIDLCIECDSIQLKCFLLKLKAILQGKNPKDLRLMSVSSNTLVPQKLPTKLVIVKKENYDVLSPLPRTLQTVQINNVMISSVDSRVLALQNMTVLNLEKNCIDYLPERIGQLFLQELYLGSNDFGSNPHPSYWKWMLGRPIQSCLRLLSLDNNKLPCIPNTIVKFSNLVTLKLAHNHIRQLPVAFGRLRRLRYLTVSNNKLEWLPSTIRGLRLTYFDYSHNEFISKSELGFDYDKKSFYRILTLRESTAVAVLNYRLHIQDGDIPVTLHDFLIETSECSCRKPTFTSMPVDYLEYNPRLYFITELHIPDRIALLKVNYCSYNCYKKVFK